MLKYVSDVNEETGLCGSVGTGTNTAFYQSIGMVERDIEQAYDGAWYLADKVPSQPLQEAKDEKLTELKTKANTFEQNVCKDMVIQSSLGYPMDADRRSQQNVLGQITIMEASQLETIGYRCGDNVTRNFSAAQLKTLYTEMLLNGQHLYNQKWAYEQTISEAESVEAVKEISIDFKMMDFTVQDD